MPSHGAARYTTSGPKPVACTPRRAPSPAFAPTVTRTADSSCCSRLSTPASSSNSQKRLKLAQPRPGTPRKGRPAPRVSSPDRKSTRLNSSHSQISYAVFCLKKKKKKKKKKNIHNKQTDNKLRQPTR